MIRGTIETLFAQLYSSILMFLDMTTKVVNYISLCLEKMEFSTPKVADYISLCLEKMEFSIAFVQKNIYSLESAFIILTCLIGIIISYYILKNTDKDGLTHGEYLDYLHREHRLDLRKVQGYKIPHPNDNTREKELAEIVYRQMFIKKFLLPKDNGWTIVSEQFKIFNCFLDKKNIEKLNNIAREAEIYGDLEMLGFKLGTTRGFTRLCDLSGKNKFNGLTEPYPAHFNKTAMPHLNVYLLVIGRITPEGRRELQAG